MGYTNQRFYTEVDANSSEVDEFTPPSGTYYLSKIGGNAGTSPDTNIRIIWDYEGTEEVLLSTHGDADQDVDIELTADGTKVLAIVLTNDQPTSDFLGGFWRGSD